MGPDKPLIPTLPPEAKSPVYLNSAAVGLQSAETVRQVMHHTGLIARRGESHFPTILKLLAEARAGLGRLVGAAPTDIGFCGSTSHGMDLFAQIGERQDKRIILCPEDEFPSSTLPWKARGFEVILVPSIEGGWPSQAFEPLMSRNVYAIVASAAQFSTGTITPLAPLAALAHAYGALLVANVTQAVGLMPLELTRANVDMAAGTGHKWLMSGFGNGFIYMPERQREATPLPGTGWLSVEDFMAMDNRGGTLRKDAGVIEYGAMAVLPKVALEAATRQLETVGLEAVFNHARALAGAIRSGAADRGIPVRQAQDPRLRGATVSLAVSDAESAAAALKEAGVVVSARGGVRLSPHAFNCLSDVKGFWSAWDQIP